MLSGAAMKTTLLSGWVSLLAVVWAAGCGGNVSTTTGSGGDGGSGGAGGSGGSGGGSGGGTTTGTTTTTTTGTTTTTSTGTNPGTLCEQLCAAGKAAGCFDGSEAECVQGCESQAGMVPECAGVLDAAYTCAIDKVPTQGCDLESICGTEFAAVQQCLDANQPCSPGTCSASQDSCSCEQTCDGVDLKVDCTSGPNGVQCSCLQNNQLVGTCQDTGLDCSLEAGCCSVFF